MHVVSQAPQGAVRLEFRITDSNRLLSRDLDNKMFRGALSKLLAGAGFPAYDGIITAGVGIKATSKTQGLRVGIPSNSSAAVELTWQEGGNDTRCSFLLSIPRGGGVDKFKFQELLKRAEHALKMEAEQEAVRQKKPEKQKPLPPAAEKSQAVSPPNVFVFKRPGEGAEFDIVELGEAPAPEAEDVPERVAEAPAASTTAPAAPQPKEPPAAQGHTEAANSPFATDVALMQQFMRHCFKYTNQKGELRRTDCYSILIDHFAIVQDQVRSVFDSMLEIGHLRSVNNALYVRLDQEWLRNHFAKSPATGSAKERPAKAAPSLAAARSGGTAESLPNMVAELNRIVESEGVIRKRLVAITSELLPQLQARWDQLGAEMNKLDEERLKLTTERNSLRDALENPRFAAAKAELNSIKALLEKK